MNSLFQDKTIDSREVAEMVAKRHDRLIADIRGYIKNMEDGDDGDAHKIVAVDFFVESTYMGANGQSRPCFNVTRKGCEMIANKLTGKKGTLFTAAYINRFHEMETAIAPKSIATAKDQGAGEAASLLKVVIKEMHLNKTPQNIIMEYIHTTLTQFNLPNLSEPEMVYLPPFEQLQLSDQAQ